MEPHLSPWVATKERTKSNYINNGWIVFQKKKKSYRRHFGDSWNNLNITYMLDIRELLCDDGVVIL